MINQVILMGRLTRNPDIRMAGETKLARYSLAVDDRFNKDKTNFISCVTFGKNADFVEKYLAQGIKICVVGRIQTGSYDDKDGKKVYTTDVVVEQHAFCESKNSESVQKPVNNQVANEGGFIPIPDAIVEELPFI